MAEKPHVTTLQDLGEMTPHERDAAEQASIVHDPAALPAAYVEMIQQRMANLAARDRRGS